MSNESTAMSNEPSTSVPPGKGKRRLSLMLKLMGGLLLSLVVLHTILVVVSGRSLRQTKAVLRRDGYPMTAAEVIPQMPADGQNAAGDLRKIFDLIKLGGTRLELYDKVATLYDEPYDKPFSPEQLEELKAAFSTPDFPRVFELVEEAVKKPECVFDIDYEQGAAAMLPHLSQLRNLCRIIAIRAKCEAQLGNRDEAIRFLQYGMIIGSMPETEPFVISQLVRLSNGSVAMKSLQLLSKDIEFSDNEVNEFKRLLSPYESVMPMKRSIEGEYLLFGPWLFEHTGLVEEISASLDSAVERQLLRFYNTYPLRPLFNADYATYLEVMKYHMDEYDRPLISVLASHRDERTDKLMKPYSIVTKCVTSILGGMSFRAHGSSARAAITLIGVACNQYKHKNSVYPETLEHLGTLPVDPATEKPFVYKRTEKGFVLYSPFEGYSGKFECTIDGKKKRLVGMEVE
ncbi:hypothetical protein BVY04_03100 [bacterium M21]|nr:hypothetical protein BVY04_03100 [bacterium M21]